MMNESDNHHFWMSKALRLARKGYYSTHPNPRVGCVIVRDGKLLSEGFHEFPGGPHAEINALNNATENVQGSTVYVTLEPCSHTGKTPPCADALIEAGPETVVIAMLDPNPLVSGRGVEKLKHHGINVITNILQDQAMLLNPGFNKRMIQQLPLVRVKMGMSLDGRTALSNGLSQWISCAESRQDVQLLRAASSAVLSTASTVINDDASLNVRLHANQLNQKVAVRQPVRVILDTSLRLTGNEKIFDLDGDIWIFTAHQNEDDFASIIQGRKNVSIMNFASAQQVNLKQLMQKLAELEINEIHTECGSRLAGALIKQNLVDELVLYIAPDLLGDQAQGLFDLGEISIMSDKIQLSIIDVRMIGRDIKITAKPQSICQQSS